MRSAVKVISSVLLLGVAVVLPAHGQSVPRSQHSVSILTAPTAPGVAASYDPVILVDMARMLLAKRDIAAAVTATTQAIAEAPLSPLAYDIRGQAHAIERQWSLAIADMRRARELYTAQADLSYGRYEALMQSGRFETALDELTRYLGLGRARTEVLETLDLLEAQSSTSDPLGGMPSSVLARQHQDGG